MFVCFVCDILCDVAWCVLNVLSCVCVVVYVCFVCDLLSVVVWIGVCVVSD